MSQNADRTFAANSETGTEAGKVTAGEMEDAPSPSPGGDSGLSPEQAREAGRAKHEAVCQGRAEIGGADCEDAAHRGGPAS